MNTQPAPPLSLNDGDDSDDTDDDSVLDFCCAKKRKCPKLTDEGDGGFVIEDVDQVQGSIRLTREQGAMVKAWLERRLGS